MSAMETVVRGSIKGGFASIDRRIGGFTLIELMVVMVILAVVMMVAGPGFMQANLNTRLKSTANELLSSVYMARGEAIKRNVPIRICVASKDDSTCAGAGDWDQGWVVVDPNDVVIERKQAASSGYKITNTGGHTLTFQPTGIVSTVSTMKICRQAPEVGKQERELKISATGRPSITKTATATCPG